jgi:vancomycin aglycone glucosyltransferase
MRVLLSTIGSRGDVQPLVALASHLKARAQDVRVCVPPDFCEWIESLGIPVTTRFETVSAAAHGCDIIVAATALQIAARSVAEKMGIPYVFAAYSATVLPIAASPTTPLAASARTDATLNE